LKKNTSTKALLNIKGIRDDIVISTDKRYLMVLEVDGVNFSLMNESQQDRILSGFERILMSGDEFKFQIFRKVSEVNMEGEINNLSNLMKKNDICEGKRELISDYLQFLLSMSIDAVVKRNYLIISYDKYCDDNSTFLNKIFKNKKIKFSRKKEKQFKEASYMLSKACKRLINEYLNIGCRVKRLNYNEILDFYKSYFRPDYSSRLIVWIWKRIKEKKDV